MIGKCPFCGEEYEVEDSFYGRMAECPSCHRKFIVGQAAEAEKPEGDSPRQRGTNESTNFVIGKFITPKMAKKVFWILSVIAIIIMMDFIMRAHSNAFLSILVCSLVIVGLHVSCKLIVGKSFVAGAKPGDDSPMQRGSSESTNVVKGEFITPIVARIVFWILSVCALGVIPFGIGFGLHPLLSILACALLIVGLYIGYELIVVVFAIEKNTRCGKEICKALDDIKDAMMKLSDRLA